jgi:hypothetical protein
VAQTAAPTTEAIVPVTTTEPEVTAPVEPVPAP